MASTYSTNLGFELPGTGDQAGTWGITNNTNIGTLIEQAISGYATCSIADAGDTTITIPNGASGEARNMSLELTGTLSATRNLLVPAKRKLYFIFNNTSGGFAVTVRVAGQPGVSVPNGQKMILVCNGTDVVTALSYAVTMSTTSLSLTANTSTPAGVFIHRPANDTIGFGVGGTERMRLDASGNFGIGTASPSFRLDVQAVRATSGMTSIVGTNDVLFRQTNTGGSFSIGIDDSGGTNYGSAYCAALFHSGARAMLFGTNNTERMRLDSSGNLGIGAANPGAFGRLAVLASTGATSFYTGTGVQGLFVSTNESTRVVRYDSSGSLTGSHAWGNGPTEYMRLTDSGNLGIGTANPNGKLTVSNGGAAGIEFQPTGGPGGGAYFNSYNRNTSAFIPWTNYASVHTWFVGTAGGTRAMDLDASGNLGIGTASPGQKLDVIGSGRSTGAWAVGDSSGNFSGSISNESDTSKSVTFAADPGNAGANSFMRFNVDGSERARIDSSGNLGIGTATMKNTVLTGGGTGITIGAAAAPNLAIWDTTDAGYVTYLGQINENAYLGNAANGFMSFGTNNTERMRITGAGNIVAGASAALATTATDGFLYVPTCAGVPTGTPTAYTGMVPIVVDTTNNRWYFYSGGAWRNAGP